MIADLQNLAEVGIDPRDVDSELVDRWQRVPTSDHPRKRNGAVLLRAENIHRRIVIPRIAPLLSARAKFELRLLLPRRRLRISSKRLS